MLTKDHTCQKVRHVPLGWTDLISCSSSVVSRIRGYLAVLYWVGFGKRDLVRLALVSTAPAHSNAMTIGMVCTRDCVVRPAVTQTRTETDTDTHRHRHKQHRMVHASRLHRQLHTV